MDGKSTHDCGPFLPREVREKFTKPRFEVPPICRLRKFAHRHL